MKITYKEALRRASFCLREAGIANPGSEAEYLLAAVLNTDRLSLITTRPALLDEQDYRRFEEVVKRRAAHEPLAYISGRKYFFGRRFIVNRAVLVPRPETELLVEEILKWVKNSSLFMENDLQILDLGTGSGVLAITLALELPSAEVWAVDISPEALQVAGRNAKLYNLDERIRFVEGSYYIPLDDYHPAPRFKLIVSNPPYISQAELSELPSAVIDFEPRAALEGGMDGLDGYRSILERLPVYADNPALVVVEIGSDMEKSATDLFKNSRYFRMIGCRRDLAGHPRLLFGLI